MNKTTVDQYVLKYHGRDSRLLKPVLQYDTETLATYRKGSCYTSSDFAVKYKTYVNDRLIVRSVDTGMYLGAALLARRYTYHYSYCAFAHGMADLRDKTYAGPNYKTKLCNNFTATGFCRYGDRCQFKHQTVSSGKKHPQSRHVTFSYMLGNLSEKGLTEGPIKRLRVFEYLEVDTFDHVDWKYRKPRTYTM